MYKDRAFKIIAYTQDVGATQEVTIYIGKTKLVTYLPGTKYEDRALDDAEEKIGKLFKEIFSRDMRWWENRLRLKNECPICHGTRCFGKDDPPSLRCT